MPTRKQMPDVMGELLGGPSHLPVNQQASKPSSQQTGKTVNQYNSTLVNGTEEKIKVTYYVSAQTVDALEEAKLKLRRLAPKGKRPISSSAIVEAALQIAIAALEAEGENSQLASILVNQYNSKTVIPA